MRITEQQRETIKKLAEQEFGRGTRVDLFGSRTDDATKGGDIDLYIHPADTDSLFEKKLRMVSLLQISLGEQKFDIVLARNPQRPIEQHANTTGIRL